MHLRFQKNFQKICFRFEIASWERLRRSWKTSTNNFVLQLEIESSRRSLTVISLSFSWSRLYRSGSVYFYSIELSGEQNVARKRRENDDEERSDVSIAEFFMFVSLLCHFDLVKKVRVETDNFNFAIVDILNQQNDDEN